MKLIKTYIRDLFILEPNVFEDSRGYFFESYNKKILADKGIEFSFIQDNQSRSQHGVIRGLHYQANPHAQTKLVRVLSGEIFDVAVDLRAGSGTYGKWFGEILSDQNKKQMLIPKGFAHGFSVLSKEAIVLYKCDDYYHPETEAGILYNDPVLNIDWKIETGRELVSQKDKTLPGFNESVHIFE